MASSSVRRRRYLAPPSSSETDSVLPRAHEDKPRKRQKRDANVYDAVAGRSMCEGLGRIMLTTIEGRVTTKHALEDGSDSETFHRRRHRSTIRDPTLAPEEVLFQRVAAPIRYAEKDIYNAHERLPDGGREVLPDSDMLKAIHNYSCHFYSRLPKTGALGRDAERNIDEQSMDETALLAFGILLEETGREILGKRGDLVFTEGMDVGHERQPASDLNQAVGFLDVDMQSQGLARKIGSKVTSALTD